MGKDKDRLSLQDEPGAIEFLEAAQLSEQYATTLGLPNVAPSLTDMLNSMSGMPAVEGIAVVLYQDQGYLPLIEFYVATDLRGITRRGSRAGKIIDAVSGAHTRFKQLVDDDNIPVNSVLTYINTALGDFVSALPELQGELVELGNSPFQITAVKSPS